MSPDTPMTQRDAQQLHTAIRDLTQSMRDLSDRIEKTYVRIDVWDRETKLLDTRITANTERLNTHSGYWGWVVKTVIAAVILAVLAGVFVSGGGRVA